MCAHSQILGSCSANLSTPLIVSEAHSKRTRPRHPSRHTETTSVNRSIGSEGFTDQRLHSTFTRKPRRNPSAVKYFRTETTAIITIKKLYLHRWTARKRPAFCSHALDGCDAVKWRRHETHCTTACSLQRHPVSSHPVRFVMIRSQLHFSVKCSIVTVPDFTV